MKRLIAIMGLSLASACSEDESNPREPEPQPITLAAKLDLEIRDQLDVTLVTRGEKLTATISATSGFGLISAGVPLDGEGSVEAFPEAESTLYTARFSAPPQAGGPCGSQPVALALALHRSGTGAFVAGSLSAYCGAQSHGTPSRPPLRLSGSLPLP